MYICGMMPVATHSGVMLGQKFLPAHQTSRASGASAVSLRSSAYRCCINDCKARPDPRLSLNSFCMYPPIPCNAGGEEVARAAAVLRGCLRPATAKASPDVAVACAHLLGTAAQHHPSLLDLLCFPTSLAAEHPPGKVAPDFQWIEPAYLLCDWG